MQVKKRCRKAAQFWAEIATEVNHDGEQTERLFKNLGAEYQKARQLMKISGIDSNEMVLRGSAELFDAFENYYSLFNPHGGSMLPGLIMTENQTA